jgi:hypothetical protein
MRTGPNRTFLQHLAGYGFADAVQSVIILLNSEINSCLCTTRRKNFISLNTMSCIGSIERMRLYEDQGRTTYPISQRFLATLLTSIFFAAQVCTKVGTGNTAAFAVLFSLFFKSQAPNRP